MSTIRSPFSSRLITSNFYSVDDADLCFSLILVRKANAAEKETKRDAWSYHKHNQSIHMTDGVTVISLSTSFLQKISVAMDSLPNCIKPKIIA